jgi:L-cystine uptake protein TcyP (sodium:dicarboxylate symporter family)
MLMYGLSGIENTYLLGYIVSGMLTGYVTGALNKGSYSFKRMVVCGVVAGIVGGLFLFFTYKVPFDIINAKLQPLDMASDVPYVMFITLLPRIIFGIIAALIAKISGPVWHSS